MTSSTRREELSLTIYTDFVNYDSDGILLGVDCPGIADFILAREKTMREEIEALKTEASVAHVSCAGLQEALEVANCSLRETLAELLELAEEWGVHFYGTENEDSIKLVRRHREIKNARAALDADGGGGK